MLRTTFDHLDTWEQIPGPFLPGSGSELRGDDYDWPPCGVSQVAWAGLQVAVDNLQAIRFHLDAPKLDRPRHFLFAHLTLCRAALVGASQTVWVLAPDKRDTRVERARTVVAYTQTQHERYLKALKTYESEPHAGTDAVCRATHVQLRMRELNNKRMLEGQSGTLNTTHMIREAAQHVFGVDMAEEAVLAWQEGSGATHGLIWQVLGQQDTVQSGPADTEGLAPFQATGSFDRIANPYMAAYHLADHGWDLLRHRGS